MLAGYPLAAPAGGTARRSSRAPPVGVAALQGKHGAAGAARGGPDPLPISASDAAAAPQIGLVVAAGAQLAWAPALSAWGGGGAAAFVVDGLSWAVIATTVASGGDYLRRGGLSAMPQRRGAAAAAEGGAGPAADGAAPPKDGEATRTRDGGPGGGAGT